MAITKIGAGGFPSGTIIQTVSAELENDNVTSSTSYVDTGLMRLNETKEVVGLFKKHFKSKLIVKDAKNELSPIAQSFWMENRRVSNKLLCETLGYKLIYKNYKLGLKNCFLNS